MTEPTHGAEGDAMSQRDEIARIGLVECITETDNVFPESWEYEQCRASAERIADALLAAGLIVPPGLTAERLRLIARVLERWYADGVAPRPRTQTRPGDEQFIDDLRAWADFLDTQETPRGEVVN